ncbi:MAG: response regulator transcription factor [Lachnospiraceae bacterium]|nr:response regulator transcription factor [Lachnospiraceae bacterium]MBP5733757.1 response regulator transcription factor [Lachnospiraceae bacterium]
MRLLLAEDEEELSEALAAVLRHNNYSVDTVYDGQEALDYLEGQEYDGVILDIMMPKKNGIEVLKTIRAHKNQVPVLLLTAKTQVDDRVEGLDAGADDYLGKPFAMKELLARVRAMTRRREGLTDNLLTIGNLSLNRLTFELSVGEEKVRLANKDFQMIEMLMVNPGQIISTERFMEKIWGYDSETEISVVWVYVSNLRKRLAALGADVEIKAVRNQGYSLELKK